MMTMLRQRDEVEAEAPPGEPPRPLAAAYGGNKPAAEIAHDLLETEAKRLERVETLVRMFPQA
jgi:hypothetical protein